MESETNLKQLPEGWVRSKVGEIFEFLYGKGLVKKARKETGRYPVYGSSGVVGFHDEFLVHGPKVIVGRKGAAGAVHYCIENCWPIDTTYFINSIDVVDSKFSFYLLRNLRLNQFETSTAIPGLNRNDAYRLDILLPPLNEQKRIVAKIEELFSELDNGISALKSAREQLKVYRQAVLKHAFEGKLTSKWREENADKLETPTQLLARIYQEREARYQQQLEEWKVAVKKWEAKGKEGKRPTKPRAIPKIVHPNEEDLKYFCALPTGWLWVKLGQLTWSVKDGPHYSPKYSDTGIPFITGGNIRPSGVDFENVKFISKELHEELSERCKPEYEDILYTKGGTTGIARVNTYHLDFNVWVHVAVLKITNSIIPFYIQHALNSPGCYAQSQKYTHGVGNQDLGLTRMINIILPICCLEEQKVIIEKIDLLNSELDEIEKSIEEDLRRSETLRQSILKKAFSGKLVPQDQNDEPACELLARIKTEKLSQVNRNTANKKRRYQP